MADGQGPARGYSWPPFEAANTAALVHGSRSPRKVAPLAEQIEQDARNEPSWPSYLDGLEYRAAVQAWARAEAVVELLWRWLAEQDIEAALTDLTTSDETEERETPTRTRRMSTTRRVTAALNAWHRAESAAAGHRSRLGLDPLSRAKLGKDVAIGSAVTARLDQLQQAGARLVEAARVTGALSAPETAAGQQPAQLHQPTADDAQADQPGGSDDHD